MKKVTLCFLKRGDEILLAMKKRGFGVGKYNGIGGKVEPNETIEDAMKRETMEEIGVEITDFEKVAVIQFYFPLVPTDQNWNQEGHIFIVNKWGGEPKETEEMAPKWFKISEIPYQQMWTDDIYWLDRVLKGEKITAEFTFGENESVTDYKIKTALI